LNIKSEALRIGFADCRIARAEAFGSDIQHLKRWLHAGMHGTMEYMSRNIEKRENPTLLVEDCQTVLSLAINYYPTFRQNPDLPQIAKYAYGKDYHLVVKDMLHRLLASIREHYGNVSGRAFTDSAPVLEHGWAARSGLGWTGKHSLTIHPRYGSYIFLGELFINLDLEPDPPIKDRCGSCTNCMDACPVQAIIAPRVIDSRRCLSYLTIEHKNAFNQPISLHGRLFGCDICQDACPWNKKAQPAVIPVFEPNHAILNQSKQEWEHLSKEEFTCLTKDSAIQRVGFEGIKRNLQVL
jgi:epoxyqueuosine reductase